MTNYFKTSRVFLGALIASSLMMMSCGEDEVTIQAPFVDFTVTVDATNSALVTIKDNSIDVDTYTWDFGDNIGTSKEEDPSYTYTASGTYTIKLTATNEGGSTEGTKEVTVVVLEAPVIDFTATVDATNLALVTINNSTAADTYAWDFGDNSGTAEDKNPSYTYTVSGTYTIKLTATNAAGSTEGTEEVTVVVEDVIVDPTLGDNLLANGDMTDDSAWTSTPIWVAEDNLTNHRFENGTFIFQNGDNPAGGRYVYSNHMFYQEVQLAAGKTYKFSADVSSSSGTLATWFEVFFIKETPLVDESNIGGGDAQLSLKSYGDGEDCSASSFSGDILDVSALCTAANSFSGLVGSDGEFTVTSDNLSSTGSIFLVFKAGSADFSGTPGGFNDGIVLDNVMIREIL